MLGVYSSFQNFRITIRMIKILFKQYSLTIPVKHRILFTNTVKSSKRSRGVQKVHHVVHKINPALANLEGLIYYFSSFDRQYYTITLWFPCLDGLIQTRGNVARVKNSAQNHSPSARE